LQRWGTDIVDRLTTTQGNYKDVVLAVEYCNTLFFPTE
jgi:hypothetical protein